MIKTTILIPNYNGIKFIENCLDSIMEMEEKYPVIIVDNGSCDGSDQLILDKYASGDSTSDGFIHQSNHSADHNQITLIKLSENTGFCHAVNVGINAVKTPYVFLLNNDTVVKKDTISVLERRIESSKKIFSVQSLILNLYNQDLIDDAGDTYSALGWARAIGKDRDYKEFLSTKEVKQDNAKQVFACCGAAVLYRCEIFDDIGTFDENHFAYLEDIDLGYRARINGYINLCEPESIIFHAGSGTSGSRHNRFKVDLSAKNNVYLIYKNMPLLQMIINLPLLILGFCAKIVFFCLKGMGLTYIKGLAKGFALCASDMKNGHRHKVWFKPSNLGHYVSIQIELWKNMIPR